MRLLRIDFPPVLICAACVLYRFRKVRKTTRYGGPDMIVCFSNVLLSEVLSAAGPTPPETHGDRDRECGHIHVRTSQHSRNETKLLMIPKNLVNFISDNLCGACRRCLSTVGGWCRTRSRDRHHACQCSSRAWVGMG